MNNGHKSSQSFAPDTASPLSSQNEQAESDLRLIVDGMTELFAEFKPQECGTLRRIVLNAIGRHP